MGPKVANRQGEHAVQALDALRPFFFVQVQDHLGIGVGAKAVAPGHKFPAKLGEIIDFAVVHQVDRVIFVGHGHMARGGQVQDGQAPAAEAQIGAVRRHVLPNPGVIGTAVRLAIGHGPQGYVIPPVYDSCNPAHLLPAGT